MDSPNHGSTHRSAQGMPGLILRPDYQDKTTLPDDDFASLDLNCLGTQIGGKAVFFSPQKHNSDDSGEMKNAQRDIRNGEHQRTVWKTTLCPNVFWGKGIPPVTFDIADGILEYIGRAIDGKHPIHRVSHTINAVSALHEGYVSERPHDVVLDRCEWTKPNRAGGKEARCVDVQRDAFFSKPISGNADLIVFLVKIRVGEWYMEGLRIGYQLYGTVFGFFGSVNGRNDGKCLLL